MTRPDDSSWALAVGTEFAIWRISMVANLGTCLDTPAHRFRDGHHVSALSLQHRADLPAVLIDAGGPIGAAAFCDVPVTGAAVLLRTGWDRHWGTERYGDPRHPHLAEAGVQALVEGRATLVGIDSVNIDGTTTAERPAPSTRPARRWSNSSPASRHGRSGV